MKMAVWAWIPEIRSTVAELSRRNLLVVSQISLRKVADSTTLPMHSRMLPERLAR